MISAANAEASNATNTTKNNTMSISAANAEIFNAATITKNSTAFNNQNLCENVEVECNNSINNCAAKNDNFSSCNVKGMNKSANRACLKAIKEE